MKILFIDDCYRKDEKYLGYGGFCIDAVNVRPLAADIVLLKNKYKIPAGVELKWSPDPRHYIRTQFKGKRDSLHREAIALLSKYNASVICAVTDLNEAYGIKMYNWDITKTMLWATKQEFKFLSERFESPYLEDAEDVGLVVADHYGNRSKDAEILRDIDLAITFGTQFQSFKKICMIPMMTLSEHCPPIQLADIVVGIIVSSLCGSRFGLDLFDEVGLLFVRNPHRGSLAFCSDYSDAVLGFGLKLFPRTLTNKGLSLFKNLDAKYIYTHKGLKGRK